MTDDSPSQAAPASDVFISYASQDVAVANSMVEALERHGIKCWIAPRDVRAGAQYADAIVRAITGTKVLLLVLSKDAVASAHVGREIERASSKKHPIIALRTDAAPLTPAFEYFLSESQWVEAQAGQMEAAYARLIEAIREPEPAAPTSDPAASPETSAGNASLARPKPTRTRILVAAGLAIVALALAALFTGKSWLGRQAPGGQPAIAVASAATISEKSIAVLPFVDMSEKHDEEYFSDGLSEELIDHLAHNPDLKVIARTSSFAFKGKNEDMRSIATKLGVANLLEGSVRKAGGELRITAQLIRASDGVHLWSESYDRKLIDIFKVQDEISTTVSKALNAALNVTTATDVQSASKGIASIGAYDLVLQGDYFLNRGDKGDIARAVQHYRQALDIDPHYAHAWAMLARVYPWQAYLGELTTADAEAKSREALQRALAIDPNFAEAYEARGNLFRLIVGDWAAAKVDYERATVLDPHGEVGEHAQAAIVYLKASISGQYDEYIDLMRRDLERNPLDTGTLSDLAWMQQYAGRLTDSVATSRELLERDPAYPTAQGQLAIALLFMGRDTEALAAAQKDSDDAMKLASLSGVYWTLARRAESDSALRALERGFADRNEYAIAAVHAYRGEADAAFAWLERTYQQRRGTLQDLKSDPLFRTLRGDPRLDAFLRKLKLLK